MRIGIFLPPLLPYSVRHYAEAIAAGIVAAGGETVPFAGDGPLPVVDLWWDPRGTDGDPPPSVLLRQPAPLVATVHGVASFTVPWWDYYPTVPAALRGIARRERRRWRWRSVGAPLAAIVTVSDYARQEIAAALPLPPVPLVPIHHGVNHALFHPGPPVVTRSYLFHVSQYQPLKNLARLFAAYAALPPSRPPLLVVAPGYRGAPPPPGATVQREAVPQARLAELYRGALAFVYPSLRESFGLPLVEAMASGCPVITSDGSACREVAGSAALLVDPRSVEEIRAAMARIMADAELRSALCGQGLRWAARFDWRTSAAAHMKVFQRALA